MVDVTNAFAASPLPNGGVLYGAVLGTALPTDASTALAAAFKDHGAAGPDGYTNAPKRSTDKKKMFGGETFITLQTDYEETVQITLLEDDNVNVLQTVFGDANVITTDATGSTGTLRKIYHTSAPLPLKSWVLQSSYGTKRKRHVIERGQVTEIAEIKNVHDDVTSYQVTIDVYKGTNSSANYAGVIEYRDNGKFLVPSNWTITVTGSAGTFTATVTTSAGSQTTSALAYNAATSAVQTAIQALSNVGSGNATVTGTPGAYAITLALGGTIGAAGTGGATAVAAAA